jgi:hypothetical protein
MNFKPVQIRLSPVLAKDSWRAEDFDAITVNMATIDRYISQVNPPLRNFKWGRRTSTYSAPRMMFLRTAVNSVL